jgi:hypothetical protein
MSDKGNSYRMRFVADVVEEGKKLQVNVAAKKGSKVYATEIATFGLDETGYAILMGRSIDGGPEEVRREDVSSGSRFALGGHFSYPSGIGDRASLCFGTRRFGKSPAKGTF